MMDLAAIAQQIGSAVKLHAWEWDLSQEDLDALILKILEGAVPEPLIYRTPSDPLPAPSDQVRNFGIFPLDEVTKK